MSWPAITDLVLNSEGRANIKSQSEEVRPFMEEALALIIRYINIEDTYPDLTRKGKIMRRGILQAARYKLPEAVERIKGCSKYRSKIANAVRYFSILRHCYFI